MANKFIGISNYTTSADDIRLKDEHDALKIIIAELQTCDCDIDLVIEFATDNQMLIKLIDKHIQFMFDEIRNYSKLYCLYIQSFRTDGRLGYYTFINDTSTQFTQISDTAS